MKRNQLKKGINELINSDNIEHKSAIICDMKNKEWPLRFYYKLEKKVIEHGDAINIYLVAKHLGLSIEKLADAIIATRDAHYIYLFVKNVKGIDMTKMIDRMNAVGEIQFMMNLALEIENNWSSPEVSVQQLASAIAKNIYDDDGLDMYEWIIKKVELHKEDTINAICATGDAEYIYKLYCHVQYIIDIKGEKLVDAMCATGNAEYIYKMATIAFDRYIGKLVDAMCATGNVEYICKMTKFIFFEHHTLPSETFFPFKYIAKLVDAICRTGNAEYIYKMAKITPFARKENLVDAMCATRNAEYIYKLVEIVPSEYIEKLVDTMCRTGNAEYIYKMAKIMLSEDMETLVNTTYIDQMAKIKPANPIEKLVDAMCKTENAEYIYKMVNIMPSEYIETLVDAICRTGNAEYIYKMAKFPPYEYTGKLVDAICATGNVEYICQFEDNINNMFQEEEKLVDTIIASGDAEAILKFTSVAKIKYYDRLMDAILNMKDIDYIIKMKRGITDKFLLNKKDFNQKEREVMTDDAWILASLTNPNVSVSAIKESETVQQNKKLYLSLLEQLNEIKYRYYKDALDGKISFKDADARYEKASSKNSSYYEGKFMGTNIYDSSYYEEAFSFEK